MADSALTRFVKGIRLAFNKNDTTYVGMKVASTPGSSYDVTIPGAPPSSVQMMTMDSSGVIGFTTFDAGTNKGAARAASTANVTIATPGAAIDGVTLVAGDLVFLKDQTVASENGLYVWNGAAAAMTRATTADTSAEVAPGMFVFVSEGTVNDNRGYSLTTNAPIVLGTTALTFTQTSGALGTQAIANGGTGATTAAAARTNLVVPSFFRQSFTDATLAAGILTVTHNLGQQYVQIMIADDTGKLIIAATDITFTSTTVATVDLTSFGTLTGTWNLLAVG